LKTTPCPLEEEGGEEGEGEEQGKNDNKRLSTQPPVTEKKKKR
jgi:hypothetical protein